MSLNQEAHCSDPPGSFDKHRGGNDNPQWGASSFNFSFCLWLVLNKQIQVLYLGSIFVTCKEHTKFLPDCGLAKECFHALLNKKKKLGQIQNDGEKPQQMYEAHGKAGSITIH